MAPSSPSPTTASSSIRSSAARLTVGSQTYSFATAARRAYRTFRSWVQRRTAVLRSVSERRAGRELETAWSTAAACAWLPSRQCGSGPSAFTTPHQKNRSWMWCLLRTSGWPIRPRFGPMSSTPASTSTTRPTTPPSTDTSFVRDRTRSRTPFSPGSFTAAWKVPPVT